MFGKPHLRRDTRETRRRAVQRQRAHEARKKGTWWRRKTAHGKKVARRESLFSRIMTIMF